MPINGLIQKLNTTATSINKKKPIDILIPAGISVFFICI